ncbi:MAG: hypothetical protein ACP5H8_02495 [Candidatus Micrarchaeia archaeon]
MRSLVQRKERLAKALESLLTELNECIVVVEGKRDVRALNRIGVRSQVVVLDAIGKMDLHMGMRFVVLTDFDAAGEVKLRKAESILAGFHIMPDNELRQRFRRLFGVRTIEDVPSAFESFVIK